MFTGDRFSRCSVFVLGLCVLTTTSATVGSQDRNAATPGTAVRSLLDEGHYQEAVAAAELLVSDARRKAGTESLETARATDVLVEALLRNGNGALPTTREAAERVLRLKETHLNVDDRELSPSLRNLANTLTAAGEVRQSVPLFERVLAIHERAEGPGDLRTAEALDDLARALLQTDRTDEARGSLDRALTIKENTLGPNDRSVAGTLEQLALLHQRKGDYPGSRPLLERALRIREAANPNDPELIDTLNLLGIQCWFEGDPRSEQSFYVRAMAIGRDVLRPDHPLIALILRNMATPATTLGNLAEARSLQERALSIAERNYGSSHPEVADYLNDLANTSLLEGDYAKARVLYERAERLVRDRLGSQDLSVATYANNLAILDARLGDVVEARRQFERAVSIWRRRLGSEHPFVARAFESLAEALSDQGRYNEARGLFDQALKIRERSLAPDHPDIARSLTDLATTLERQGQVRQAQELAERAIRILERSDAPQNTTFANTLTLNAILHADEGNFQSAREYYERALTIWNRVFGGSHPNYAETQAGLAVALAGLGDSTSAVTLALQAEETGRQHIRLTLRYLPERQSLSYAATRPKGVDLAMSLSADRPDSRVFDAVIKGRALVLDEMAARRRVRTEAAHPELAPLWAALTSARQRLANLVVRGPGDQRPQQYLALVEDARQEKELAERSLADKSTEFRDELARGEIGVDEVRAALPARSALVGFKLYERTLFANSSTTGLRSDSAKSPRSRRTVPSYVAFVISAGQPDISIVPLGAAAGVDALVVGWRKEATSLPDPSSEPEAERAYRAAGSGLRHRLWDPIALHVKDATTVFVVPDGTLNLVSLAALPVGQTKYLIDGGPVIHYLSAERDLAMGRPTVTGNHGLLAIGGADFDDSTLFTPRAAKSRPKASVAPGTTTQPLSVRAGCGDLQSLQFEPLEGTRKEIHELARLWTGSQADVLENRGASEGAFKHAASGHRVLHLATHGFFLGSDCSPGVGGTRSVGGLSSSPKKQSNAGLNENPLLLSGLALAGANRRAAAGPGDEDGILTGEEVAALNLDGVEWAVLSACDTGLGALKVGEGVFGLRRAFQVAGVRTVIMSLWPVEDQATLEWMRALYAGRLQKHLSTADAMREASLTILRARRAKGQSTHPFYWGGFVAAGDWR
jgi:CHAT domain-containing protein/tetratricopeptide (TPR) repeat protein